MKSPEKSLSDLFINLYGKEPDIIKIKGEGGSQRSYYRLKYENISVVGAYGTDRGENKCFVSLATYLKSRDIKVPGVLAISNDWESYLMEDLGDSSLLPILYTDKKMPLATTALEHLLKFQLLPEKEWKGLMINSPFSERMVKWDLNYFKYDFLKPIGVIFDEMKLEDDFEKIIRTMLAIPETLNGIMYRDFQSRNIMIKEGEVYFIDFQGARKGPVIYDLVSFLWQAKAPFSSEEREMLASFYISRLAEIKNIKEDEIRKILYPMVLLRTLQVLGAYGLRGIIERKQHFLESIPKAILNLVELKDNGFTEGYNELNKIIEKLKTIYLIKKDQEKNDKLTLTIFSFSYKKGYPEDNSGNGGGFMFDCRALPNPGRYEEYKKLTGKDREVIEFLEKESEPKIFLENVVSLVIPSIERYMQRGFNSLQIGFGCTGGQHRSVFCAENLAKKIQKIYGDKIKIHVIHREQKEEYILETA